MNDNTIAFGVILAHCAFTHTLALNPYISGRVQSAASWILNYDFGQEEFKTGIDRADEPQQRERRTTKSPTKKSSDLEYRKHEHKARSSSKYQRKSTFDKKYNGKDDLKFRNSSLRVNITEPDFSPYYFLCPESCSDCTVTLSEILCRICCPSMFPSPLYYTDTIIENTYTFTARVLAWIQNTLSLSGLRLVYQNWLQKDDPFIQSTSEEEINALIRNFHWLEHVRNGGSFNFTFFGIKEKLKESSVLPNGICGYYENVTRRTQGKVVGGEMVDRMRLYPWQMSLATGFLGMFYSHRCGGALISDQWVLTAAHCVADLYDVQSLYVMGGFLDLNNKDTAQIRLVEEYFIHEDYKDGIFEQDIALLKLSSPIVFTPNLLPICLPPSGVGYNNYVGTTAVLTGWGRQWAEGPLSDQLFMVKLPIISNKECMEWYSNSGSRQFIPERTFLCAGWESGGRDACSGDSGGPLTIYRRDGRAELVGVVSWGIGCGDKGRPGVYTRVSQFVPWIKETIRAHGS